jgi:hypothetical protein
VPRPPEDVEESAIAARVIRDGILPGPRLRDKEVFEPLRIEAFSP